LVQYNFDATHIEKNVCENIINALLVIAGKSKDNLNICLDLQALGIRSDTIGKTELYVGHNNFRRLEGKPTEIT
jgi:hypothetical protein